MNANASQIVAFWRDAGPAKWYAKDDAFDGEIRARFLEAHEAAARGEFARWEDEPEGALALLILLDQFPRNLFRDSAHAFATDPAALAIARRSVARGHDLATQGQMRQFFYLPFMHSEALADQEACVIYCEALGLPDNLKYAIIHRDIIARFGRFPHRNRVMARTTTSEEQAFLDGGGFAG